MKAEMPCFYPVFSHPKWSPMRSQYFSVKIASKFCFNCSNSTDHTVREYKLPLLLDLLTGAY